MAIMKILGIEGASITWSFKQISKMIEQNKISFDNIIQRSYVWEILRRSKLIWNAIMGYPIPPIYAKRGQGENEKIKIYDILDGQQRNVTVAKFRNNEFALSELPPIPYLDEEGNECEINISGMTYSELPEELQDAFDSRTLTIYYYDTLSQAQQAHMFRSLNNGKPLSTKARVLASCQDIEGLLDIGSHKLFDEMLTAKSKENKNQVSLVVKAWCMMNQKIEDVSFESKIFNPMLEKAEISEVDKLKLIEVFDLIFDTHYNLMERKEKRIAKKLYTETHLISLVPYFKKAVDNGIGEDMMADWIENMFGTGSKEVSNSEKYNDAISDGGLAKNVSIVARDEALAESYAEFFKVDEDEDKDEDETEDDVEIAVDETTDEAADEATETEDNAEDDVEENTQLSFTDELMNDTESEGEDEDELYLPFN